MATLSGEQANKQKMATARTDAPQQRDISLAEVYEVVRDEFVAYANSIDLKRRTCINNTWRRLGLFWRAADNSAPTATDSQCEIYQPTSRHTHTIIFLHGRDSTASEFAPELLESEDSQDQTFQQALPSVRWVFPTASMINSARFNQPMSQWFDMHTTENPHEGEEEQDPTQSIDTIHRILAKEAAILGDGGHQKVILAGISQGAAVGIHALLKQEQKLGGFIGLNTWLPNPDSIKNTGVKWPEAVKTKVMLAHTRDDPVINVKYGEELRDNLKTLDMNVVWHDYETKAGENAHWVNEPEGVDDIVKFVQAIME